MDNDIKNKIREEFFSDWLKSASKEEIIEKLIQNDDKAKLLHKIKEEDRILYNHCLIYEEMTGICLID